MNKKIISRVIEEASYIIDTNKVFWNIILILSILEGDRLQKISF